MLSAGALLSPVMLFASWSSAEACIRKPLPKYPVEHVLSQAEVVFIGRYSEPGKFVVEIPVKGVSGGIYSSLDEVATDCDLQFSLGERWLFAGTSYFSGTFQIASQTKEDCAKDILWQTRDFAGNPVREKMVADLTEKACSVIPEITLGAEQRQILLKILGRRPLQPADSEVIAEIDRQFAEDHPPVRKKRAPVIQEPFRPLETFR